MPDRRFSEEEVREIVRRASEQQAEDRERRRAAEHGLSLDDLERLGAEVGLDPVYLRRAAGEVRTGRRTVRETETKTDTHVIVERRVTAPFTPEAWEDTVALLRQRFGVGMGMWYGQSGGGRVEQVGRAHEWAHTSQLGVETRVSVSERDGQTRLLLSQRVGQASPKVEGWAIAAVVGLVLGVIAAIGVGDALDSFGAFMLVWTAITFLTTLVGGPLVARLDRRWRDKKLDGLKDLAADIERVFEDAAPRAAEQPALRSAAPADAGAVGEPTAASDRLDLDAVPDAPDAAGSPARNRTRS